MIERIDNHRPALKLVWRVNSLSEY